MLPYHDPGSCLLIESFDLGSVGPPVQTHRSKFMSDRIDPACREVNDFVPMIRIGLVHYHTESSYYIMARWWVPTVYAGLLTCSGQY